MKRTQDVIPSYSSNEVPTMQVFLSGFDVTIREQNGEDEDILTRVEDTKDGSALNKYISNIVVTCSLNGGYRVTPVDVMNWKTCDKYHLLIQCRIFSLGHELKFEHTFKNGKTLMFEEDLRKFVWDFNPDNREEYPEKGKPGYYKYRVKSHPGGTGTIRILELSSGKKVRYVYMTGVAEKEALAMDQGTMSLNDQLRLRNLELFINGNTWVPVNNFKAFPSRDMKQIREDLEIQDPEFLPLMELRCGEDVELVSVISVSSFF